MHDDAASAGGFRRGFVLAGLIAVDSDRGDAEHVLHRQGDAAGGVFLHLGDGDDDVAFVVGVVQVEAGKDEPAAGDHAAVVTLAAAGRAAARPGVPAEKVDRATRAVIEKAGYGKFFTHRTGHGLGMEGHEDPYIRAGNTTLLAPGMTFTVEPGIYLPQRNGVRIEDDVVITSNGLESLTDYPREVSCLL